MNAPMAPAELPKGNCHQLVSVPNALLQTYAIFDKIMKMKWDVAGGGAHLVVAIEGIEDLIPMNRRLKSMNLPSRVAFMNQPCSTGRSPRTDHEEGSREPLHFYVQIKEMEDLAILVIPPKFVKVMREWLVVKLPRVQGYRPTSVATSRFRSRTSTEQMVLGRGWQYFFCRHKIVPGDLLAPWISGLGLKLQIDNHGSSIMCRVRCSRHSCINDISLAL
ncbi:Protein transport protein Sec31A [Hordeum vulgare]|nr:Protein transport protein Sec31A [Hordeum vulgare]